MTLELSFSRCGALAFIALTGTTLAQTTARVSVSTNGVQGDADSVQPSLSGDGRFVVFASYGSSE